jgi:hypothetical protein
MALSGYMENTWSTGLLLISSTSLATIPSIVQQGFTSDKTRGDNRGYRLTLSFRFIATTDN